MTHPTSIHLFGQMQHKEYEAQAARVVQDAQGAQAAAQISNPLEPNEGLIMGKIAQLLQEIRAQIATQPSNKASVY